MGLVEVGGMVLVDVVLSGLGDIDDIGKGVVLIINVVLRVIIEVFMVFGGDV